MQGIFTSVYDQGNLPDSEMSNTEQVKKISEQDFIELVRKGIKGILDQGKPAKSLLGACFYLTDTGLKCIVGQMMPDDKTRISSDSVGGYSGILSIWEGKLSPWVERFSRVQIQVLYELQGLHDDQPADALDSDFEKRANNILDEYINNLNNLNN